MTVSAERRLEEQAQPFRSLYQHWERTHWQVGALDFTRDAESFAALDPGTRRGFVWMFAHRFHAEFEVATLLAPFLAAAPTHDVRLLLATQVADEYRHLQCVLRIYEEVFGVEGGIDAVKALADRNRDQVASTLYDALEAWILRLRDDPSVAAFDRAVFAYHLVAEGVVARAAQGFAGDRYAALGDFPGLAEGQRLVARDEARHIGIGVTYLRRRMETAPEETRAAVGDGLNEFARLSAEGLELGRAGLQDVLEGGYGVDADTFHAEAMRLLQLRLRSIGYAD